MNFGVLGIAVDKLEPYRLSPLSPTASDFGERVFEPVHHVDAHAMRCACHRIEDRFAEAYRYASQVMTENMMARDAEEGICAFIEKRDANWEDR